MLTTQLSGEYSPARRFQGASPAPFLPGSDETLGWTSISTNSFRIYVAPGVNLNKVYKRLNRRSFETDPGYKPPALAGIEEKIGYRVEALLGRVQELLDIYPSSINVRIKIYKARQELNDEFRRIFRAPGEHKSFYVHRYQTIYMSEKDIDDSVLAHEIGHVVVDNYFNVIPPETIREMLASYVDLHLED